MKAHQRIIREREASGDTTDWRLFEDDYQSVNCDISNAVVREVSYGTAKEIIMKYEWLGSMPAAVIKCFGIFYDHLCAGVVVYSTEYSENLGVWDKFGYTNKMILLSRGACVHWAHEHSASKLIRQSMRMLPDKYEVVTCTVDPAAGEIGTIYQACGFYYVGAMREANRDAWMINGKLVGERSLRKMIGTQKKEEVLKRFPHAEFVKQFNKGRYFAFRGSRLVKRTHLAALEHLIKPYPKRVNDGI